MQFQITFDLPLTDVDRAALRALIGDETKAAAPAAAKAAAPAAAKAETAAPAAKKAAAPAPKVEEKTPLEQAVERATALVGAGKHLEVKAALTDVGVPRVSLLTEGDVEGFNAALDAAVSEG